MNMIEKWATGVLTAITVAVIAALFSLWSTVSSWPFEKQLMLIEHEQIRARIAVNEANIEELENELKELQ